MTQIHSIFGTKFNFFEFFFNSFINRLISKMQEKCKKTEKAKHNFVQSNISRLQKLKIYIFKRLEKEHVSQNYLNVLSMFSNRFVLTE